MIATITSAGELAWITWAIGGGYRVRAAAVTIDWALDRARPPPLPDGVAAPLHPPRRAVANTHPASACPVRTASLGYALETRQRAGIWGGTTEDERREIRSAKTARPAFPPPGDARRQAHP